jgi:hypothetical protein
MTAVKIHAAALNAEVKRAPTRRKTNRTQEYEDNLNTEVKDTASLLAKLTDPATPDLDAALLAHAVYIMDGRMSDRTGLHSKRVLEAQSIRRRLNEDAQLLNKLMTLLGLPIRYERAPFRM